ncbi:hypothetical protein [Nostoc cycadae]|uniref:hypothetical protein n=1 Tax=Nostoc cycadae TaxID=246795 RepID=UPI0016515E1D|nr:hypothetical protein [Nostoc cycadae]
MPPQLISPTNLFRGQRCVLVEDVEPYLRGRLLVLLVMSGAIALCRESESLFSDG